MYPANLFSLFPPFPRDNRVFVAMSFDRRFDKRWHEVIGPGVRDAQANGDKLEPHRVDVRTISDSIVTEIVRGIGDCRLFLGDVTTVGHVVPNGCSRRLPWFSRSKGKPIRNENVMYEVGIAHSVRLAEEVILFRSDNDPLLFDLANIRINNYEPDRMPNEAKQKVTEALTSAVKEVDLQRHLAVKQAAGSLDFHSWSSLLTQLNCTDGTLKCPAPSRHVHAGSVMGGFETALRSMMIARLLELRILTTRYLPLSPNKTKELLENSRLEEALEYTITPFGREVLKEVIARMGVEATAIGELWSQSLGVKA